MSLTMPQSCIAYISTEWVPLQLASPPNHRYANGNQAIDGHLDKSRPALRRILVGHGGRNVQVTLYRELRTVFDQFGAWVSERSGEPDRRGPQESLAALTAEIFAHEIDLSVEAVRAERAQAAVAYFKLCKQTELPIDQNIQKLVKNWREEERSGPVRQILDRALVHLQ